jgi:hypothetical protein
MVPTVDIIVVVVEKGMSDARCDEKVTNSPAILCQRFLCNLLLHEYYDAGDLRVKIEFFKSPTHSPRVFSRTQYAQQCPAPMPTAPRLPFTYLPVLKAPLAL